MSSGTVASRLGPVVVATGNAEKYREARLVLQDGLLEDVRWWPVQTPEDAGSLHGNALMKARKAAAESGLAALADDTAFEVDALDGRPGLWVARYARARGGGAAAVGALLDEVRRSGRAERSARFRCVVVCVAGEAEWAAEGVCEGTLLMEASDAAAPSAGFTFDGVFVPEGAGAALATLPADRLLTFSHRSRALRALLERWEAEAH